MPLVNILSILSEHIVLYHIMIMFIVCSYRLNSALKLLRICSLISSMEHCLMPAMASTVWITVVGSLSMPRTGPI